MLTLLFWILVCGVLAWAVYAVDIPQPYKTFALGAILIFALVVIFTALGVHTGIPIR